MPYSTPTSPASATTTASPVHSAGRPGHRRSYTYAHSHTPTFSNERGPGAFVPLGALPRRKSHSPSEAKFTLSSRPDGSSSSASNSDDEETSHLKVQTKPRHLDAAPTDDGLFPAGVKLRAKPPSFLLSLDTRSPLSSPIGNGSANGKLPAAGTVPFPRSSPSLSPGPEDSIPSATPGSASDAGKKPVRPSVTRTASSPTIFLSNGKPLKSSLKSSSSTSSVVGLAADIPEQIRHIRARSAPSTPGAPPSFDDDDSTASSPMMTPTTPKNVHFAPPHSLASVKVFNRSARPNSVSLPLGADMDNETDEGESSSTNLGYFGWASWTRDNATWSRQPSGLAGPKNQALPRRSVASVNKGVDTFELDRANMSCIPANIHVDTNENDKSNIILEKVKLEGNGAQPLHPEHNTADRHHHEPLQLSGVILVRNVSFEKRVAVRFTLDDWNTTSEVGANWIESLPTMPAHLDPSAAKSRGLTLGDLIAPHPQHHGPSYDRFQFKIRLSDYVTSLPSKTLFLVARYSTGGESWSGGSTEWWDNNNGYNYMIMFKRAPPPPPPVEEKEKSSATREGGERRVSAPAVLPGTPTITTTSPSPTFPLILPPTKSAAAEREKEIIYESSPATSTTTNRPPPISTTPLTPQTPAPSAYQTGGAPMLSQTESSKPPAPPDSAKSPTAQAASKRLRGFSLSNYVAPGSSRARSGSGSSTSSGPASKQEDNDDEKKDENNTKDEGFRKEGEKEKVGIHWNWASSAPPAPAPTAPSTDVTSPTSMSSSSGTPTPMATPAPIPIDRNEKLQQIIDQPDTSSSPTSSVSSLSSNSEADNRDDAEADITPPTSPLVESLTLPSAVDSTTPTQADFEPESSSSPPDEDAALSMVKEPPPPDAQPQKSVLRNPTRQMALPSLPLPPSLTFCSPMFESPITEQGLNSSPPYDSSPLPTPSLGLGGFKVSKLNPTPFSPAPSRGPETPIASEKVERSGYFSPPMSRSRGSGSSSGSNSRPGSGVSSPALDSESLYKAFVKQWCFAESPAGSPGPSSGTSSPNKGGGHASNGQGMVVG